MRAHASCWCSPATDDAQARTRKGRPESIDDDVDRGFVVQRRDREDRCGGRRRLGVQATLEDERGQRVHHRSAESPRRGRAALRRLRTEPARARCRARSDTSRCVVDARRRASSPNELPRRNRRTRVSLGEVEHFEEPGVHDVETVAAVRRAVSRPRRLLPQPGAHSPRDARRLLHRGRRIAESWTARRRPRGPLRLPALVSRRRCAP